MSLTSGQEVVANHAMRCKNYLTSAAITMIFFAASGCELPTDPNAVEKPKIEEVKEKKPAQTYLGKAMESANKLKNETVPNYNKRLEELSKPPSR